MEPGHQRGPSLEGIEAVKGVKKGLLYAVLGIRLVAEKP
jgi:hypothetical protein